MTPALLSAVSSFDTALAHASRFADPEAIASALLERYRRRLQVLAPYMPVAGSLATALPGSARARAILLDPPVRSAIDHSLAYFKIGETYFEQHLAHFEHVLGLACAALQQSDASPLLRAEGAHELHLLADCYLWQRPMDAGPATHYLQQSLNYRSFSFVPQVPTSTQAKTISAAGQLLAELLPEVSLSALAHAYAVVVVDTGMPPPVSQAADFTAPPVSLLGFYPARMTSFSYTGLPGTFFLAPCVVENPWQAAEFILHEALHQKFQDLVHTQSILAPGYRETEFPVLSPWNPCLNGPENWWSTYRSLAALHVYVYLLLFCRALEMRRSELSRTYGPPHLIDPAAATRMAAHRSYYLGRQLQQQRESFGADGNALLDWLMARLAELAPAPPVPQPLAPFYLELYARELDQWEEQLMCVPPERWLAQSNGMCLYERVQALVAEALDWEVSIFSRCQSGPAPSIAPWHKTPPTDFARQVCTRLRQVRSHILRALAAHPQPELLETCLPEWISGTNRYLLKLTQHLKVPS